MEIEKFPIMGLDSKGFRIKSRYRKEVYIYISEIGRKTNGDYD